jgi:hypothetical protein
MSQYHCAICGGVFPLGDLTRRELVRGQADYVCCRRGALGGCAALIDRERTIRPVGRERIHVECSACGGEYCGDEPHVCAVDCLTADEGEG